MDQRVIDAPPDGSGLDAAVAATPPDLIVMDITLPGLSGLELAQRLRGSRCSAAIVFLTVHCDANYARAAFASGASGYVVKARMAADLTLALRAAQRGQRFVSPCPELEGVE